MITTGNLVVCDSLYMTGNLEGKKGNMSWHHERSAGNALEQSRVARMMA